MLLKNWDKIRVYDLTLNTNHMTPPWPTYEPLNVKYFKRLAPNGANGMIITTSNHVGTHLDGPQHFDTGGRDIASLEMEKLVGPGVVVDISDIAEDWSIYTPQDLMDRADIRKGDIIFIYTGYHKYSLDGETPDERRYMLRHPGPSVDFADWMKEMELKYIAVDAGSADHPMNTKIRDWEPREAEACDAYMREKYGKGLNEIYTWPDTYQAMHIWVFPQPWEIIHVECLGGEIDIVPKNKRMILGTFPWKFQYGESAFCRCVAFDTVE
ncbi:MAG: cyclase family protein [Clostridiaceae bacterium]|nr:cyclase family protein [Clostridiaceae bacterium]